MYKRTKEQVHFIGIGGIGMSGIAEVLLAQGFPVSGSDIQESDTTRKLHNLGARISTGHHADNLAGAKVVVFSSAVKRDNPEFLEAQRQGIPLVPRAEMLAELMRLQYGVAVAGTHGKTTTTSMLATILAFADEDPTIIVGGKVDAFGGNAKLGSGKFLIAEADESDGSFLSLSPVVTIITNIDNDHLDYYGQMEKLRMAFVEFANKIPYYGRSILCIDDSEVSKLFALIAKPSWTYGFSEYANFQITDYHASPNGCSFTVLRESFRLGEVHLKVPGEHNARNAVGALAAALELDIPSEKAILALNSFGGVRRRFEMKGVLPESDVLIVDDYGHHPTEIEATLKAAKGYTERRVVAIFQPHRYSRTRLCWDQFANALRYADEVYITDIYPAGELPIEGIHSELLCDHIRLQNPQLVCHYAGDLEQARKTLESKLRHKDMLITLGAGNITQLGPTLLRSKGIQ